ncbi:hypothetical protein Hanom_Chr14g01326311 [Helianthus anomalus]
MKLQHKIQSFSSQIPMLPKTQTNSHLTHYYHHTRSVTLVLCSNLSRNINSLHRGLFHFRLRHRHRQYTVLHRRLHLIHFRILRQPKPPQKLPRAPLHPMPLIILLLIFSAPLSAYLQHSTFFNLHLHLLLLQPRQVCLEDVSLWCLLPVDSGIGYGCCFTR